VAALPAGWPLLGAMLCVAAGSLGLFPTYYALTQDLSRHHQGKLTGLLSFATWVVSAVMQAWVGEYVERTKQFALAIQVVSAAPLVALVVLLLVWPKPRPTAG
jgi:ACS family hexuronate transporter-like MFS transporter